MAAHARLSASSAHRWLVCPQAPRIEAMFPDTGSRYAAEGTAAHEVAARCLRTGVDADTFAGARAWVHPVTGDTALEGPDDVARVATVTASPDARSFVVDAEMVRSVQRFVDAVRERNGELFVEVRLDYSAFVPEGFGTGDAITLAGDTLYVDDLKYGRGVPVDAATYPGDGLHENGTKGNPQGMLYGLGALLAYDPIYPDIRRVVVGIHQPRLDHISEFEIGREDLIAWADTVLRDGAARTEAPDAPFVPGEKQCRFCKGRAGCRAAAAVALATAADGFDVVQMPAKHAGADDATGDRLVDVLNSAEPVLDNAEIAALLPRLDSLVAWASAVEAYAQALLERGETVPGYKLVEGRGSREYVDEDKAAAALSRKVGAANAYTKKLVSPAAAEKLVGKDDPFMARHVRRVPGKPTIAPVTDKREAIKVDPASGFGPTAPVDPLEF